MTRVLELYDRINSIAIKQLQNIPFGLKILLCAPVSNLKFVLNINRPSDARADLRAILCTKPVASVQQATSRLRMSRTATRD